MRTPRLTFAGATVLMLAIGTAGTAVAQTETDSDAEPVGVVVKVTWEGQSEQGRRPEEPDVVATQFYDLVFTPRWEATDPRLSGDATRRLNRHEYESLVNLYAFHDTLVNDGGRWEGTGIGISPNPLVSDPEYGQVDTVTLHGSGGYEGLTAYLTYAGESLGSHRDTLRGVIVPDGMPPVPEPPTD